MSDHDALLNAVFADPQSDAPRLVYTDLIEERAGPGDADRACPICAGQGRVGRGNNGNPYLATCDECDGAGRTGGVLRELARTQPVKRVETGIRPALSDDTGKYFWPAWSSTSPLEGEILPLDIWSNDSLSRKSSSRQRGATPRRAQMFATIDAALDALSKCLLAEARSPAPVGVPT